MKTSGRTCQKRLLPGLETGLVLGLAIAALVLGCATPSLTPALTTAGADTLAISALARDLSSDARRGRGPWTRESEQVARELATHLAALGARPLFETSLVVPFTSEPQPRDTAYNVAAVLPSRSGSTAGQLVGLTAHFDHLGVGRPVAGDSIYNGFLDDAVGVAMIMDIAKRYVRSPGDRPLAILFFDLEEQGLLGAKALVARADAATLVDRLGLLIGVDAGSPAGEATRWQLMGASPPHAGAHLADSLARARGWTGTHTPARAISDVFPFSQHGVPIIFPIPGAIWKGYTTERRAEAMRQFDHYHQPGDEWRPDFPWTGTAAFADWLWDIVRHATEARRVLR